MTPRLALILLLPWASACFPYRETYRPALRGVVLDDEGRPLAGALVRSCSVSKWHGLRPGECPRPGETYSNAAGRFSLPTLREWEWCCLGEAPLPITALVACRDGQVAGTMVPRTPGEDLVLTPMPTVIFTARQGGTSKDAAFFLQLCGAAAPTAPPPAE